MVDADAAVDLVVDADLLVQPVLISGQLHPVHSQVGMADAGTLSALGVDLGKGDEGATVVGPGLHLG